MLPFSVLRHSLAIVTVAILFSGSSRTASALDNGVDDSDEDPAYPNVCAVIGVPAQDDPDPVLRMGSGTLIHPRVVLTSGHVTDWFATIWNVPAERARISFSADAFDDSQWLEVEGYCTHPLYNGYFDAEGRGDVHDMGVVILKEAVVGIEPATLPYEGLLDDLRFDGLLDFGTDHGTLFTTVGYGWGYSFPPPTPLRDERGVRRYGPMVCMGMMKSSLHFLLDPDGPVTMNGDSGGPTILKDGEGNGVVVAITMWGSPVPGIDHRYRIDAPDALDFLEAVMTSVECDE